MTNDIALEFSMISPMSYWLPQYSFGIFLINLVDAHYAFVSIVHCICLEGYVF